MDTVTLQVWRRGGMTPMPSEQEPLAHQERSLLLHGMRHALGIGVLNWGEVDDENPHEMIEILIQLAPVIIPAFIALVKLWVENGKLDEVVITLKNGTVIQAKNTTPEQMDSLIRSAYAAS